MTSKKQKERKKKAREQIARMRVLSRRVKLRKERKEILEQQQKEEHARQIVHGKSMPFVKMTQEEREVQEAARAMVVKTKLEENMQILEALEQEYDAEQASRDHVNAQLEAEGHKSMKEKMDALHEKALKITGKDKELEEARAAQE